MTPLVLDASALLALLNGEPGADKVAAVLDGAALSAVNLAETAGKLDDLGIPAAEVRALLGDLGLDIRPFDTEQAHMAGALRRETRPRGLSLGDRACLALAIALKAEVLTADRAWSGLSLPVRVHTIR